MTSKNETNFSLQKTNKEMELIQRKKSRMFRGRDRDS